MSIKSIIQSIKDELGSHQIIVDLKITGEGVEIISKSYADALMATKEMKRRNIKCFWNAERNMP